MLDLVMLSIYCCGMLDLIMLSIYCCGMFFTFTGYCDQYTCTNDRCINNALRCSDYNPCGDESDCIGVEVEEDGGTSFVYYLLCQFPFYKQRL